MAACSVWFLVKLHHAADMQRQDVIRPDERLGITPILFAI